MHIAIAASTFAIVLVLTATLMAVSVNREVTQYEYIVPYDTYKMQFYGIKEQGRYTTGVGVDFYSFQRTLQDLDMTQVTCQTHDKIQLNLEVKIQIRMERDTLISVVLKQFGGRDSHHNFLKRVAESSLISTCLDYEAEQYYTDRAGVDTAMFKELQRAINDNDFGATVEYFQLNGITLPPELAEVITEKQNIAQEVITATNDRENQLIQARTNYLEAEQEAKVIVIKANNTATVLRNKADTQALILQTEWTNRGIAYQEVKESLDLTEEQFLGYLDAEVMRQVKSSVVN